MMKRSHEEYSCLLAVVAGIAVAGVVGCSERVPLYQVSGKVLHHGQPAAGAVVYFHRQGGTDGPIPYGVVEEDGSFNLVTEDVGAGARPGKYSVLVEWADRAADGRQPVGKRGGVTLVKRSRVRLGADKLKGRYLDAGKPLLHAEVDPKTNQLPPFELTD